MLRGQPTFVQGELTPAAGAWPLCILFSSAPLLSSLIKQTSMKQTHTVGFISCSYQSSSNLLFPNKLIEKCKKKVYHKLS